MQRNSLGIPLAIIVAAGIVGAAIYFGDGTSDDTQDIDTADSETPEVVVEPISAEDHILGNPNAPIVLIEYSDFDCPFCKDYHATLKRVMDEYGPRGDVAWVFRHFPIPSLHPNAPRVAEASECVAELGGNEAFWKFSDQVFEERGTNDPTNILRLPEFAANAGVDQAAFESCYQSRKYQESITADIEAAIQAGGTGTPHTIVMVGNEMIGTVPGAQTYTMVKGNIDSILLQIQGGLAE